MTKGSPTLASDIVLRFCGAKCPIQNARFYNKEACWQLSLTSLRYAIIQTSVLLLFSSSSDWGSMASDAFLENRPYILNWSRMPSATLLLCRKWGCTSWTWTCTNCPSRGVLWTYITSHPSGGVLLTCRSAILQRRTVNRCLPSSGGRTVDLYTGSPLGPYCRLVLAVLWGRTVNLY